MSTDPPRPEILSENELIQIRCAAVMIAATVGATLDAAFLLALNNYLVLRSTTPRPDTGSASFTNPPNVMRIKHHGKRDYAVEFQASLTEMDGNVIIRP